MGANVYEAQGAESRADFIHKFKVAARIGRKQILVIDLYNVGLFARQ